MVSDTSVSITYLSADGSRQAQFVFDANAPSATAPATQLQVNTWRVQRRDAPGRLAYWGSPDLATLVTKSPAKLPVSQLANGNQGRIEVRCEGSGELIKDASVTGWFKVAGGSEGGRRAGPISYTVHVPVRPVNGGFIYALPLKSAPTGIVGWMQLQAQVKAKLMAMAICSGNPLMAWKGLTPQFICAPFVEIPPFFAGCVTAILGYMVTCSIKSINDWIVEPVSDFFAESIEATFEGTIRKDGGLVRRAISVTATAGESIPTGIIELPCPQQTGMLLPVPGVYQFKGSLPDDVIQRMGEAKLSYAQAQSGTVDILLELDATGQVTRFMATLEIAGDLQAGYTCGWGRWTFVSSGLPQAAPITADEGYLVINAAGTQTYFRAGTTCEGPLDEQKAEPMPFNLRVVDERTLALCSFYATAREACLASPMGQLKPATSA
jgi:hypothetical protein